MLTRCLLAAAVAALSGHAAATILVIERRDQTAEYQLDDSPSQFGPKVGITGLAGALVLGQPVDGCMALQPPPVSAGGHKKTWLVLLTAGNCSDGNKVLHAGQAGYGAAIVYNISGDGFSPMQSDVTVNIPSFFIGESNGIMLRSNFLYGSGYTIYITGYFPYTFLAFIVPAMLLIVLCLLVVIAIMLYRCVTEYRRTARRLLPKRVLARIPTRTFAANSGTHEHDTCAICLEDYQEGDELRVLPCKHAFHCRCVDPWLLHSRRVCPVCKRRLISATVAELVSDSEEEQLLTVSRSQRQAPTRRTYGATLTGRNRPSALYPAAAAAGEPQVHTRSATARRTRRTRRRGPERRLAAATTAVSPSGAPVDDPPAAGGTEPVTAADNARLLDDARDKPDEPAATVVTLSEQDQEDVTVAPRGGSRTKLRPGQYTRLEESSPGISETSTGSAMSPAETSPQLERPPADGPAGVSGARSDGQQQQQAAPPPPPPAAAAPPPAGGSDLV